MSKLWRPQFSLRTLFLATLVLGVTPWLVSRYLTWQEHEVWNAFYAAVHDRDAALREWRGLHSVRKETSTWKRAEADARARDFAAEQRIDGKLQMVRSFCNDSPEKLQQATEIRDGQRTIPERDMKSLARTTK